MAKKEELFKFVKQWIQENDVHCPEVICQRDSVAVILPEFVEKVCDIVGYHEREDD